MSAETLFTVCNNFALLGWLLLVFAPRWKWTARLVIAGVVPLLLAAVYLFLIVMTFGKAEGGFNSLAGVAKLFQHEWVLLAGWVHYLVFDLFVGSWEVSDAQKLKINHLLVVPCLIMTFLLGPIGFLMYHAVSLKWRRNLSTEGRQ
ncbi:MAG TPA: ABA4-like family protein [Blastocatellia bacterium]|nr:ABA4-like family protein [Blastocatellia bacterium]